MLKSRPMKRVCLTTFILVIFIGGLESMGVRQKDQDQTFASLIPAELMGWTIEEDQVFDAETIFKYVDGAGEVYRSYNMRSLFARRFAAKGKPALVVDLFDMGTSADAFGLFTHDLEGEDAATGQGSTYKGGLLSFWKGRYFASVYAEDETPETKQAVLGLARKIDGAIRETGEMPALVSALPLDGLQARDVRYFHNHSVLNYHFFVADENILHLDQTTAAVLASYGDKDARSRLLVVRYPSVKKAEAAIDSFVKAYMPDAKGAEIIRTEDGKWTAARRKSDVLVIVFQAPTREFAEGQLRRTETRIGK
ncbi:MAG: hypothetical protein MUP28_10350 [Candidatus Aminicenantes bacterium]|nr:hypothetical protein [Candidatus Aminicenantes bacterium]